MGLGRQRAVDLKRSGQKALGDVTQGWLAEGAREAADPKRLTENRERLKSHVKRIRCQKRYDPDGGRPYCGESNAKEGPERMPQRPGASRPKRHATPRTPREGHPGDVSGRDLHASKCLQHLDPGCSFGPVLCWRRRLPSTVYPPQSTSRHGQFSPVEASAVPGSDPAKEVVVFIVFQGSRLLPPRRSTPPTAAAPSTTWPCHTTYVPPLSHRAQRHDGGASFGVIEPKTARTRVAQRHRCASPNDTPQAGNAGQTTKATRLTTIPRADRRPAISVGTRWR